MTYGFSKINILDKYSLFLDKYPAKLVKISPGLLKWCYINVLISLLAIRTIRLRIPNQELSTSKSSLQGTLKARHFYRYLLFNGERNLEKHKNLLSRTRDTCYALLLNMCVMTNMKEHVKLLLQILLCRRMVSPTEMG